MRRRGFRRKPAVVWLPNVGTPLVHGGVTVGNVNENPSDIEFFIPVSTAGEPQTFSAPLVLDNPREAAQTGAPLSVLQTQGLALNTDWGYRLRRIVADYVCAAAPTNDQATNPGAVSLELGLIVRRVDPTTGNALSAAQFQDVNTLENNRDPWIWRRSIVLGQGKITTNGAAIIMEAVTQFPPTNMAYGNSKYQHIDQKTARRIGPEERLFLNITAWLIPYDETIGGSTNAIDNGYGVYFKMSYRALASRVNAMQGNRRNASR